jgi:heptosyltransferase-2
MLIDAREILLILDNGIPIRFAILEQTQSSFEMRTSSPQMNIPAKKWKRSLPPRRVLAIRLQAMGDLVITLPYLQQLRKSLPADALLDLLTREEVDAIPRNIHLFDKVFSIGGGRDLKKQLLHSFWLLPRLLIRRYDVVIDLQNNVISQLFRKAIKPRAWSQFDRFSPVAAGERTRATIEAVGLGKSSINADFRLKNQREGLDLLQENGWEASKDLLVLNPAGAFTSRNWPIDRYVQFARLWLQDYPNTQFLVMGTGLIASKSDYLKNALGISLVNLVNKTTPVQAFAILQRATLVLSEDSGLMHMAWVSGIPTLVLFGSTRSDWARPLGAHSLFLDSSDLVCGNCMQQDCIFGDTHCLTRYSAEMIFSKAVSLIS